MKKLITAAEFLQAYSEGRISSREAMEGIGVDSLRELLDALLDSGFGLPRGRGREGQVEREVALALPMLAEALGRPLQTPVPE